MATVAALGAAAALMATIGLGLDAQAPGPCEPPNGNPVACENLKVGNLAGEWDVEGAGDSSIQGFATDISVNCGEALGFKINTAASDYRLDIYRMGYYSGMGARKIATCPGSTSPSWSAPTPAAAVISSSW